MENENSQNGFGGLHGLSLEIRRGPVSCRLGREHSVSRAIISWNYGWLPLTGVGTGLRLARQQRSQTSSG